MNVSLTPELESYARAKVESGRYNSASEVVRDAFRLHQERDARLDHLRELTQEGLASGPARPYDREEMRALILQRASELRAGVGRGDRTPPAVGEGIDLG